MLIIAMGPNLSQMNTDIANFINYTFLGAYTEVLTKTDFSLTSRSFQVLVAWIIGLLILTSLSLKFNKNPKAQKKLFKKQVIEIRENEYA